MTLETELREWLEREEYGTRISTNSEKVKNVMKGQAIVYRRVINWLDRRAAEREAAQ